MAFHETRAEFKQLRRAEIITIYQDRLIKDFIPAEVKPLQVILKAVEDGIYECLGLFDESEIIGYAFLVKQGTDYLVDYIAIFPDHRNKGFGGETIGLLREYLSGAGVIIAEVEDPDYSIESSFKNLQIRRIEFYKRNGCVDTGLRVRCFGVPFIIISMGKDTICSKDKLWDVYRSFYKAVLPREMFENNIEYLDLRKN